MKQSTETRKKRRVRAPRWGDSAKKWVIKKKSEPTSAAANPGTKGEMEVTGTLLRGGRKPSAAKKRLRRAFCVKIAKKRNG